MSAALDWMGRRVEGDPTFLASVLAEYAVAEKLDDVGLAMHLGCPRENLASVRLCRVPRSDPPGFRADIAEIASAFGVHPTRLITVIRRVQSLQALRGAKPWGSLMAARERPGGEP